MPADQPTPDLISGKCVHGDPKATSASAGPFGVLARHCTPCISLALAAAREEGRREGLRDAAVEAQAHSHNGPAIAAAIRALAAKEGK